MRLRYGDNATGKSVYAKKSEREGALVLTSRMKTWVKDNTFEQFRDDIAKENKSLNDIKAKLFIAASRASLGYTGSNTILKNMISRSQLFNDAFSSIDSFNEIEDIEDMIDLGEISEQLSNIDAMNNLSEIVHNLGETVFENYIDIAKFKMSVKTNIENGNTEYISRHNILKNEVTTDIDSIEDARLKELVKKGDMKTLEMLRNEDNPGQIIHDAFIIGFIKNAKLFKKDEFLRTLGLLKMYIDKKMEFSISQSRIKKLNKKYGIKISISTDLKSFKVDGDLADGQFTSVSSEMILGSAPSSVPVILDDILETLDDESAYNLMETLSGHANAEILTHSSAIASLAEKVSETNNVPIETTDFVGNTTISS